MGDRDQCRARLAAVAIVALLLTGACRNAVSPEVVTLLGGGGHTELAQACFVDDEGFLYLGGNTAAADFPTTPGVVQPAHSPKAGGSNQDGFIAKLTPDGRSLVWSTHLGGSDREHVMGLRVDAEGYVYAVGWTKSPDFPATPGALHRSSPVDADIFVAKLAPDASTLEYVARVDGSTWANTRGSFGLDSEGRVWILGSTRSHDFPATPDAWQPAHAGGGGDVILFALSADGSHLEYSTFLGGSRNDAGLGFARHEDGTLFAAGWTRSPDFPVTPGAAQGRYGGGEGGDDAWGGDAWVARFSAEGKLLFSTFFGGPGNDASAGNQPLAVSREGNAVLIGTTRQNVPTTDGAFRREPVAGVDNGFVLSLAPDGSRIAASTLTGGGTFLEMSGIAVDDRGRIYHAGRTNGGFPITRNAFQSRFAGGESDTMLSVFSPDLTRLLYSTYLGGSGDAPESSRCLWIGPRGQVLMSGDSGSPDFPTTPGAFQEQGTGKTSAFGAVWPPSVAEGAAAGR